MNEVAREQDAMSLAIAAGKPSGLAVTLDRWIEPLSPRWVANRVQARQELGYRKAMLAYTAGSYPATSYQRISDLGPLVSEEAELPGYSRWQIVTDARDLYRNDPIVRGGVNGIARRSISTGINPIFHTSDPAWNREAKEQWFDWCEVCELRGLFDLMGIARQIIKSCFTDGDLGIILANEDDDLRLQLIEADRIAENYRVGINIDTYQPLGGVVYDPETGRPLGYKVGKRGIGGLLVESSTVPAESMILMFRQQRVDQMRGVPLLAPVITTARDLNRYITATRMQANIAATYGVVVKREGGALAGFYGSTAATNTSANYRTQQLKTGLMTHLAPGESIETFKPDVPGPQFDSFAKFLVRMIAIGMGTTYEYLMQDYSNMSFSSSRTNLLDMTLTMQEWQRFIISKFLSRVYPTWVSMRMESGRLPFNDEALNGITWQQPAELGVDPQKDASANIELLRAGLTTYEDLYQKDGKNFERAIRQKALEVKRIQDLADEMGVAPELISNVLPPGVAAPGGTPPANVPPPTVKPDANTRPAK